MPLVIPALHYQVAFHHRHMTTGKPGICTLGIRDDSGDFPTMATTVEAAWLATILRQMSSKWQFVAAKWQVQEGTIRDQSYTAQGAGTDAAATPQVAYLLKKSTAQPGRHNRGRMYLPGVEEPAVDDSGFVTPEKIEGINDAADEFMTTVTAAEAVPVILHNDATPPSTITQITCQPLVATQRRRLR